MKTTKHVITAALLIVTLISATACRTERGFFRPSHHYGYRR
jgi:predicted small secreted protein